MCVRGCRTGTEFGIVGCGDDGGGVSPVDDQTTTIDVNIEDDPAATDDDMDDENQLHDGFDAEEEEGRVPADMSDERRHHDQVSLRIDDSDMVQPPSNSGQQSTALTVYTYIRNVM